MKLADLLPAVSVPFAMWLSLSVSGWYFDSLAKAYRTESTPPSLPAGAFTAANGYLDARCGGRGPHRWRYAGRDSTGLRTAWIDVASVRSAGKPGVVAAQVFINLDEALSVPSYRSRVEHRLFNCRTNTMKITEAAFFAGPFASGGVILKTTDDYFGNSIPFTLGGDLYAIACHG